MEASSPFTNVSGSKSTSSKSLGVGVRILVARMPELDGSEAKEEAKRVLALGIGRYRIRVGINGLGDCDISVKVRKADDKRGRDIVVGVEEWLLMTKPHMASV